MGDFDKMCDYEGVRKKMIENNNKEYVEKFVKNVETILTGAKYIGKWDWGDPAGKSEGIDTYEVESNNGVKVWCSIIEYVNASTGVPNRCGILATYPVEGKKSLGSILAATIPYEFSKRFNTRAYCEGTNYEIRNYGKITVGRAGIKKEDFFEFFETKYPSKVFLDEESLKYIKIYEYDGELSLEQFADQTCEAVVLLEEFKKKYR